MRKHRKPTFEFLKTAGYPSQCTRKEAQYIDEYNQRYRERMEYYNRLIEAKGEDAIDRGIKAAGEEAVDKIVGMVPGLSMGLRMIEARRANNTPGKTTTRRKR